MVFFEMRLLLNKAEVRRYNEGSNNVSDSDFYDSF